VSHCHGLIFWAVILNEILIFSIKFCIVNFQLCQIAKAEVWILCGMTSFYSCGFQCCGMHAAASACDVAITNTFILFLFQFFFLFCWSCHMVG